MKKAALTALLAILSLSLAGYCPIVTTLSNSTIPCASGLSSDSSQVHAYLWLQGKADWTTNGTGQVSPGSCTAGGTTGGCDSDGVDIMDETCLFDGTSILGPWQDCASGSPGEYYLFTDWANYVFDGCPSNDSSERAILLIYDNTGKYVLQSRSQGKDWDNWDEIGTTAAGAISATVSRWWSGDETWNTNQADLSVNIYGLAPYGSYGPGDAPSSPLITGYSLYFYFGPDEPTDLSISAWTAGDTFPAGTTTINNYNFPDAPDGLWMSIAPVMIDGREMPFVLGDPVAVHWEYTFANTSPGGNCDCNIHIFTETFCWPSCVNMTCDALIDGTEFIPDAYYDGWPYDIGCDVTRSIKFQYRFGNVRSPWTAESTIGPEHDYTPSQPVITSIIDNDPASQTGITIYYTPGTQATSHNLYRDNVLIQSNFGSGSVFSSTDCNISHNYMIRAENQYCINNSDPVSATDECDGAPGELALGATSGDALVFSTDKITASWPSYTGATGYRLYRGAQADLANLPGGAVDNSCLRYDGASTSIDLSGDTPTSWSFFWYLVTAYNGNGEGPGTGRIINSSGGCP